jgi:flavodoxin
MSNTQTGEIIMRKIFKIIGVIFVVLILLFVAFAAVIFLDVAALTATGSQTLSPSGNVVGNALVVYDPGLSGAAKEVAFKIASALQTQGYTVNLAGVKSSTATDSSAYSIVVVGGPVYAGALTNSIKDYLNTLKVSNGTTVGVFGSGQGATTPQDVTQIKSSSATLQDEGKLSNAIVVKIGSGEDLNARSADFVVQLIESHNTS